MDLKLAHTASGWHLRMSGMVRLPDEFVEVTVGRSTRATTEVLSALSRRATRCTNDLLAQSAPTVRRLLLTASTAYLSAVYRVHEAICMLDLLACFAKHAHPGSRTILYVRSVCLCVLLRGHMREVNTAGSNEMPPCPAVLLKCSPTLSTNGPLCIVDGRHPIIEQRILLERMEMGADVRSPPACSGADDVGGGDSRSSNPPDEEPAAAAPPMLPSMTANTLMISPDDAPVHVVSGANMSGKSVFLRMVGTVTVMAHLGFPVPASDATVPACARLTCRAGEADEGLATMSSFVSEMVGLANVLDRDTRGAGSPGPGTVGSVLSASPDDGWARASDDHPDSPGAAAAASVAASDDSQAQAPAPSECGSRMLLLDEVGRGTNPTEGRALFQALLEYLSHQSDVYVILVTHFRLPALLTPRVRMFHTVGRSRPGAHGVQPGTCKEGSGPPPPPPTHPGPTLNTTLHPWRGGVV